MHASGPSAAGQTHNQRLTWMLPVPAPSHSTVAAGNTKALVDADAMWGIHHIETKRAAFECHSRRF